MFSTDFLMIIDVILYVPFHIFLFTKKENIILSSEKNIWKTKLAPQNVKPAITTY